MIFGAGNSCADSGTLATLVTPSARETPITLEQMKLRKFMIRRLPQC